MQNGIRHNDFPSRAAELSVKNWGISEPQIREEMDRQEMSSSSDVTLLFALKWFNSDLTNRGKNSDLVKGLIDDDQSVVTKVETENELMSLCYLSYLETNNYLKADQRYLFGELARATK